MSNLFDLQQITNLNIVCKWDKYKFICDKYVFHEK
jgi:hypothetical protein